MAINKEDFIAQVESMTVAELNDLVKALEEKFVVSAASFAAAGAPAGGSTSGEEAAEKDSFNIILKNAGSAKIQVIKVLRELTGFGLQEGKEMTDNPGVVIKEGVKKADADEMKVKLESAGAVVELK